MGLEPLTLEIQDKHFHHSSTEPLRLYKPSVFVKLSLFRIVLLVSSGAIPKLRKPIFDQVSTLNDLPALLSSSPIGLICSNICSYEATAEANQAVGGLPPTSLIAWEALAL